LRAFRSPQSVKERWIFSAWTCSFGQPLGGFLQRKGKERTSYLLPRKVLLLWRTLRHFSPNRFHDEKVCATLFEEPKTKSL
jgi:hypothetical protein